jgi:hypothetical protein
MQLAMMIAGFYSFCNFMVSQGICEQAEADEAIQHLLLHFLGEAKIQITRSKETRAIEKFMECLAAGINTKRMNMATIVYDGSDKYKDRTFSQPNNTIANIWKYRKNSKDENSIVYTILSLKACILDMKKLFDMNFADSLKHELAENHLLNLDEFGSIQNQKVPDPENPAIKKGIRAVVIPASVLFPERLNDDREPDGF